MLDYKEIKIIEKELEKLYKSDYRAGARPYLYFEEINFSLIDGATVSVDINWGTDPDDKNLQINNCLDSVYLQNNISITEQVYFLLGIIHQYERSKE